MDDNDTLTLDQLVLSARKNPSYWMQVALLEFLQSLGAVRVSKGKPSNKELARLIGVSPPTLSRWLNGGENLTISTMCRLATALGAAVHIHVADNTKKGRWRAEAGEVGNDSPSGTAATESPGPHVSAKILDFFAYMPAVDDPRVERATLRELAQSHG